MSTGIIQILLVDAPRFAHPYHRHCWHLNSIVELIHVISSAGDCFTIFFFCISQPFNSAQIKSRRGAVFCLIKLAFIGEVCWQCTCSWAIPCTKGGNSFPRLKGIEGIGGAVSNLRHLSTAARCCLHSGLDWQGATSCTRRASRAVLCQTRSCVLRLLSYIELVYCRSLDS